MERAIRALPLPILLMGASALAMYLPATHALITHHHHTARSFFYSGTLFLFLTALVALANAANPRPRRAGRASLLTMLGAFTILPAMLAVPFDVAVPDTSFFNSWWEMVSSFTTTGGTLYEPERLIGSVHLWRGLVAWMGGFFILVMAIAVLAPMRLGGFEVFFSGGPSGAPSAAAPAADGGAETSERIAHYAVTIAPIYAGLTILLWVVLLMAGDEPLVALIHAMSTLSTSGISPVGGMQGTGSGLAGEALIFVFLLPALSRRLWPGGGELRASERLGNDPELRLAAALVLIVPAFLFVRHWIAALEVRMPADFGAIFNSIWGSLFTSLSFLTTTGFESSAWHDARDWSGLSTPGLILAGLAIIGGGGRHHGGRCAPVAGLCALAPWRARTRQADLPQFDRGWRFDGAQTAPGGRLYQLDFLHAFRDFDRGGDDGGLALRVVLRARDDPHDRGALEYRAACRDRGGCAPELGPSERPDQGDLRTGDGARAARDSRHHRAVQSRVLALVRFRIEGK